MAMMPNQRTVTLKLTRGEVCKLLIGLTAISQNNPADRVARYQAIHTKIKAQLQQHDEKWKEDDT